MANKNAKIDFNPLLEVDIARYYEYSIDKEELPSMPEISEWLHSTIIEDENQIWSLVATAKIWVKSVIDIQEIARLSMTKKPNIYDVHFIDGETYIIRSDDIYNKFLQFRSFNVFNN